MASKQMGVSPMMVALIRSGPHVAWARRPRIRHGEMKSMGMAITVAYRLFSCYTPVVGNDQPHPTLPKLGREPFSDHWARGLRRSGSSPTLGEVGRGWLDSTCCEANQSPNGHVPEEDSYVCHSKEDRCR